MTAIVRITGGNFRLLHHLLAEALLETSTVTGNPRYRNVVRTSLDTLWLSVRRSNGSYPNHWNPRASENNPTELLWIASAARAYAYAAPHIDTAR